MSVFKRFTDDLIVKGNPTEVTLGIWTGDTGSLTSFFTASNSTGSAAGKYYWNIYNIAPSNSSAEVQFAVSYGHRLGGGNKSLLVDSTSTLASQATYQQYRNMLLDPSDTQFTFDGDYNSNHIYVINVQRARLKEKLDPGNWQLKLSGSNGVFTFIDDSAQTLGVNYGRTGAVYNVVSGSLSGSSGYTIATSQSANFGGFGLAYPSLGIIVLNPQALTQTVGFVSGSFTISGSRPFAPNTGTLADEYNHAGLVNSIRLGGEFQARSAETISSTHFFINVGPKEFNYSNNPTFYDETDGAITNTDFINDPRVYITTIGLYNDANELLAVAKPTRPIQKSKAGVLNMSVRLDW